MMRMEERKNCGFIVGGMPCGKWADKVLYTRRAGQLQMMPVCNAHADQVLRDHPGEFSESAS